MSVDLDRSFGAEFGACAPALAAWASLRVRGPLERDISADDLVQEVACRAFARREQYDASVAPFRAWLFGIARNVLLRALEDVVSGARGARADWLSTQGVHRIPDDATSVTQRALRSDHLREFLDRVDELDDDDRKLIIARGLEGLSHAEVGALLDIEEATASKRWDRLRERLRGSWADLELTGLD